MLATGAAICCHSSSVLGQLSRYLQQWMIICLPCSAKHSFKGKLSRTMAFSGSKEKSGETSKTALSAESNS